MNRGDDDEAMMNDVGWVAFFSVLFVFFGLFGFLLDQCVTRSGDRPRRAADSSLWSWAAIDARAVARAVALANCASINTAPSPLLIVQV